MLYCVFLKRDSEPACCLEESFRISARSHCCMRTRSCRRVCDEGLLMFADLYCPIFRCPWLNCDCCISKISNRFLIPQGFFIRSDLLCICAIWFQAKAMAAAEAGNEPQHKEMETSGQSGNVLRVGPSRISDHPDCPLQTLRKSTSGAGSQNLKNVG